MERHYLENPAIKLLLSHIEPGSKEKESQVLWENLLWTVFPASEHWLNTTKHRNGGTDPDNKVTKLVQFNTGLANVDVLIVELKRRQEDVSQRAFNHVADAYLDDYMSESANPRNTILFVAVGLGAYVQFYHKTLPDGALTASHEQPYHLELNCDLVQSQQSAVVMPPTNSPSPVEAPNYPNTSPSSVPLGASSAYMTGAAARNPYVGADQPSVSPGYHVGSSSMYAGTGQESGSEGYQPDRGFRQGSHFIEW